jgi:hypothetical protein
VKKSRTAPIGIVFLVVICSQWLIVAAVQDSTPPTVKLEDVTQSVGISFFHQSDPEKKYLVESMSGGIVLFDYNNDNWPDLYLVNSLTVASAADPKQSKSEEFRSHLYRNNKDGTFSEVGTQAGVGFPGWGMGGCVADYNGDGWLDLYVTCLGRNSFYRNNGDGTFSDVAEVLGLTEDRYSAGCGFGDYDNDGDLDLFVSNYVDYSLDSLPEFGKGAPCQYKGIPVQCGPRGLDGAGDGLYRNDGEYFTDVSKEAGVDDPEGGYGLGVLWTDADEDGHVDLFVANDAGPNFLYRNKGDGSFEETGFMAGTAVGEDGSDQGTMGVASGDYDGDGQLDFLITNFSSEYNTLYRFDADFLYSDISFAARIAEASIALVGWGTDLWDYDNDGDLDILIVNGHVYPQVDNASIGTVYHQRKLFFRNEGNGTFKEVAKEVGSALIEDRVSRGAAFGDLDNDGDIDVAINDLDGPPMILRNQGGNRNNWLRVKLAGKGLNKFAMGARVKVTAGRLNLVEEVQSGGSYISQNDLRLHFGLGQSEKADIEVHWPWGEKTRLESVDANQESTIKAPPDGAN